MEPQKRTRSAGPVNLILTTFSEDIIDKMSYPIKREKKVPKQKEQEKRQKQKQPQPQPKQHRQKHLTKHKQSERKQEKAQTKQKNKTEDSSKNGIGVMTKEKQDQISKMLSRLNKINQIKKMKEEKGQVQKIANPSSSINNQSELIDKKQSKNEALVDLHCSRIKEVKVYVDSKNFSFSSTFNQSDVSKNINKFYIIQILQSLTKLEQFYIFTRWGRVGLEGNKAESGPFSLSDALDNYRAKVQEKFQHNYKKIETVYQNSRRNFYFPRQNKKNQQVESKLELKVQSLIRMIFDMKMITSQMNQIGYDSTKMPLGKIAQSSIIKGYTALKEAIDQLKGRQSKEHIIAFSNKFYSNIPHYFGMKNTKILPNLVLDTQAKIKAKLQLLQSIQDIQVYTKLIEESSENPDINQLDANYLRLNYQIKILEKGTPTYCTIMKYVENTHGQSHNQYKIEVDAIYELTARNSIPFRDDLPNRRLLWHGSRLTNFVGILSNGLRIAPREAPVTGYMFGKGVYFADVVSKSANYCYATKLNSTACLLLCEVALGTSCEKFYADYYAHLVIENEYQSVKGIGKRAPKDGEMLQDVFIPNGHLADTGISNTSLHYNEYVVYDVSQIKCRYLLKIKFLFK